MTPNEIMNRFPIGAVFELSPAVRDKLAFLHTVLRAINFVPKRLDKMKRDNDIPANAALTPESEQVFLDLVFKEDPFAALLSNAVAITPTLNTDHGARVFLDQTFVQQIIWCLIFKDLNENHKVDRFTWGYLKLNLLENPPNSQVIVIGWEFNSQILGRGRSIGPKDICPDTPPSDILGNG